MSQAKYRGPSTRRLILDHTRLQNNLQPNGEYNMQTVIVIIQSTYLACSYDLLLVPKPIDRASF